jgi:hypothetical protein
VQEHPTAPKHATPYKEGITMPTVDRTGSGPTLPEHPRTLLGLWTEVGAEMRAAFDHLHRARSLMQDMLVSVPIEHWRETIHMPPGEEQ